MVTAAPVSVSPAFVVVVELFPDSLLQEVTKKNIAKAVIVAFIYFKGGNFIFNFLTGDRFIK